MKHLERYSACLSGAFFFACALVLLSATISTVFAQDTGKVETLIRQEVMRRSPSLDKAKIEITFKNPKELSGLSGQTYRLGYPENMPLAGEIVIPVDVYTGSGFERRVNLNTSIKISRQVAIAASRIRQGELFTLKNMEYAERNVTRLPSNYIVDMNKALGRQASTFIPKGSLILDWMPKEVPAVRTGRTIDLFKRVNGVFVKVKAVAVEDGYINGNIRVRNIGSNKVVEGRVINSGEVEAI